MGKNGKNRELIVLKTNHDLFVIKVTISIMFYYTPEFAKTTELEGFFKHIIDITNRGV